MATAAVWGSIPDSMIQNQVVDQIRVQSANGRLVAASDQLPLGDRYVVIAILGLNESSDVDGPSEAELLHMVGDSLTEVETVYKLWTDGDEFLDDVKVYGFWYNSSYSPEQIAKWFDALVEANPELTGKDVRFSVWCHSMGGLVAMCYWNQTDRKLDAKVTLGTPMEGALFADQLATDAAFEQGFPKWLGQIAKGKAAKRKIDFNAPGTLWLRSDCEEVRRLHQVRPFDSTWTLVAGTTTPSKSGVGVYVDALLLLDRIWFASGSDMDPKAYQLGAYVIQSSGVTCGSDGVTSEDSALYRSGVDKANRVVLQAHNHGQVWWGNSSFELAEAKLKPLMPYILAKKAGLKPKAAKGFDIWLPPTDINFNLPAQDFSRLETARMVWVDEQGRITVADEGATNPTSLPLDGAFSWPQWLGNDIVATWQHGSKSDVVWIQADGRVKMLTNDGVSGPAGVGNDMVAWVSRGEVFVWRKSEAIAKIVAHGAEVDTPPAVFPSQIYLACKSGGSYDLRSIKLSVDDTPITMAKLEQRGVTRPMKFGLALLAIKQEGDVSRLVTVSQWWSGALDQNIKNFLKVQDQENVPSIEAIDLDDQSGAVYLLCDGDQISQLNTGILLQSMTQKVSLEDWSELAPQVATGVQLDLK